MQINHTKAEILDSLEKADVASVATSAGIHLRQRMMHFAIDKDFQIYLSSMKGDPKTIQITGNPAISLLVHNPGEDLNSSSEVEITGRVFVIKDDVQRRRSLEMLSKRSPVVNYLVQSDNESTLACLKVVPQTIKSRVFSEIVKGAPPTVLEFPEYGDPASDVTLLRKKIGAWIKGIRAPFLTASTISILLGTAIAWANSQLIHWRYFILTLIAGTLLHAGANVLNDYFDHKSGNDEKNREYIRPFSGGSRMIQLGLLTPLETLVGAMLLILGGSVLGLYLAWARGPFILYLGLFGFFSAVFYSAPTLNWVSRGFGEVLVGINFGMLMTVGAYYSQTQEIHLQPIIVSIPLTILVAAILFINGFLDYAADSETSKKTLVVRLGRKRARIGYVALIALCFLSLIMSVIFSIMPVQALVGLAALPFFIKAIFIVRKHYKSPSELTPANAFTITGHMALGLILTLIYIWVGFVPKRVVYFLPIAVAFVGFGIYFYFHIEKRRQIFLGLKSVVGR